MMENVARILSAYKLLVTSHIYFDVFDQVAIKTFKFIILDFISCICTSLSLYVLNVKSSSNFGGNITSEN